MGLRFAEPFVGDDRWLMPPIANSVAASMPSAVFTTLHLRTTFSTVHHFPLSRAAWFCMIVCNNFQRLCNAWVVITFKTTRTPRHEGIAYSPIFVMMNDTVNKIKVDTFGNRYSCQESFTNFLNDVSIVVGVMRIMVISYP